VRITSILRLDHRPRPFLSGRPIKILLGIGEVELFGRSTPHASLDQRHQTLFIAVADHHGSFVGQRVAHDAGVAAGRDHQCIGIGPPGLTNRLPRLLSATCVTVQVLTTYTSAHPSYVTHSYPAAWN
jgi:hypothetical protein